MKKILRLLIWSILSFSAIVALLYIVLLALWLRINLNPDKVSLTDGSFTKLIEFRTKKNTLVEIYGKRGDEPNSGEFVIVRRGVLPFGIVLVSRKTGEENLWHDANIHRNINGQESIEVISDFIAMIGFYYESSNETLWRRFAEPSVAVGLSIVQTKLDEPVKIEYLHCDGIPVFAGLCTNNRYKNRIVNKPDWLFGLCLKCNKLIHENKAEFKTINIAIDLRKFFLAQKEEI